MAQTVTRTCKKCEKTFTIAASRITHGRGIFCSRKCKGTSQDVSCANCGKDFRLGSKAVNPNGNYCSRDCHYKAHGRLPHVDTEGTVTIPLTRGYIATVDVEDLDLVKNYSWSAIPHRNTVYARALINGRMMTLHQYLMGSGNGVMADHVDRDGLNNRRSNLRLCNDTENKMNRGPDRDNQLGLKGVRQAGSRFLARIQSSQIGYFDSAEDAARAYDDEAVRRFGEFAYTNFPTRKAV